MWYVKIKNCVLKTIVIVCLLISRGMTKSWNTFITICYSPFLRTFIYLATFHYVLLFNRFITLYIVVILHVFINLHVCLFLISVLCIKYWAWPMDVTLVKILAITRICYLKWYFNLIRVSCVTILPLSTNVLHTTIRYMHIIVPNRTLMHLFIPTIKHYSRWFILDMIIPNFCVSESGVLNGFGISYLCSSGSVVMVS